MAEIRWCDGGLQVRCHRGGFSVTGAGFYVWDERLSDALAHASLLHVATSPPAPPSDPPVSPGRTPCESPS